MKTLDVRQYWLKRGQTYMGEERLSLDYHRAQERFLLEVLREGRLPLNRLLEVGCGFGRITKQLAQNFPAARITALDLSPDQLANAGKYCADCQNITFRPYDFYSAEPLPGNNYDCVLAIEVFLHHPEPVIRALIERLLTASQYVVSIDWSEHWPWKTPEHVWVHDYRKLYADADLRCASFALPEKVDGKQQRLFVAGRDLPPELIKLERRLHDGQAGATEASPQDGDKGLQELEAARQEMMRLIPPGGSFILVNEEQWSAEQALPDRRALPFLERHGQYWGPPPDDETAIRELDRLHREGAEYIVFHWPSFWWLDHYTGFHRYLRKSFPCLLENQRVTVFSLEMANQIR